MKSTNLFKRIALACFAVFMVSLTVVGITFAKYVRDQEAQNDSATVAAFGVTLQRAGGALFNTEYAADDTETLSEENAISVKSRSTTNMLAPGNKNETGTTISAVVSATNEVAVKLLFNIDATAENWLVGEEAYEPVKFTVKKTKNSDVTYFNGSAWVAEESTCVASQMNDLSFTEIVEADDAETRVSVQITWEWDFDANGAGTNDSKDTILGEATPKASISVSSSARAEQID